MPAPRAATAKEVARIKRVLDQLEMITGLENILEWCENEDINKKLAADVRWLMKAFDLHNPMG